MAKKEKRAAPVEEGWLSLEQTADMAGISRETLRRWARDGDSRLPAYRVWDEDDDRHGRFRFKRSDVEAFQVPAPTEDPPPGGSV